MRSFQDLPNLGINVANSGKIDQAANQPQRSLNENQHENEFLDFGEVNMPTAFRISEGKYGYCLLATQNFKKGDFVYENRARLIPHSVKKYRFVIDGKEYVSDCLNSVKYEAGRHAYTFDGFMNHSCDPNTRIYLIDGDWLHYEHFATKDIKIGDEIFCNYFQFDYLCDGHQFQCMCGSPKCYKHINGFKNLSLNDQVGLLHMVYPQVAEYWMKDNPKIVLVEDLHIPGSIEIVGSQGERKIVAKREIKENEVIFEQRPMMLKQDSILVMKLGGDKYEIVDLVSHSVNRGEHRQFLASACFINHSCSPNSALMEKDGNVMLVSLGNIHAGEEITYDYSAFNTMSDAEFPCWCHSANCRKVIEGRKVHVLQESNQIHTC